MTRPRDDDVLRGLGDESPFVDTDNVTHPSLLPISEPRARATALGADNSSNLCTRFDAVLGLQSSRELWENLKVDIFHLFPPYL